MPLEDWLPEYDVRERHERRVDASPGWALELALRAPSAPDGIVRALLRLRGVPPPAATIEDLAARLGLVADWVLVGPFSALIRRRWLRAIVRSA